jgi:hypothetical protein
MGAVEEGVAGEEYEETIRKKSDSWITSRIYRCRWN